MSVLRHNIKAMQARREREEAVASASARLADRITRFTGSMRFVVLHLLLFGVWFLCSTGAVPFLPVFDQTLVGLATFASVEAIFLSTFVLISQNRMMGAADKRADLDLQINLLAEHEVTKLLAAVSAIADRLGVQTPVEPELNELQQDISPGAVLDELDSRRDQA